MDPRRMEQLMLLCLRSQSTRVALFGGDDEEEDDNGVGGLGVGGGGVVIRVPPPRLLRLLARSVLIAAVVVSFPWIRTLILRRGGAHQSPSTSRAIAEELYLPILLADLRHRGLLRPGAAAAFLGDAGRGSRSSGGAGSPRSPAIGAPPRRSSARGRSTSSSPPRAPRASRPSTAPSGSAGSRRCSSGRSPSARRRTTGSRSSGGSAPRWWRCGRSVPPRRRRGAAAPHGGGGGGEEEGAERAGGRAAGAAGAAAAAAAAAEVPARAHGGLAGGVPAARLRGGGAAGERRERGGVVRAPLPAGKREFEIIRVEEVAAADAAKEGGMAEWLERNVREEDYVVVKAEAEVAEEVVRRGRSAIGLVDELFLECRSQWESDKAKETRTTSRRAYWECLALYGRLRDQGVANFLIIDYATDVATLRSTPLRYCDPHRGVIPTESTRKKNN
uniref:DUF7870 domain-containing protein n=1 Tax=Ananas comosus var. bracteatus TaxID=296719 RepID=A0A6V7QRS8_ANACO